MSLPHMHFCFGNRPRNWKHEVKCATVASGKAVAPDVNEEGHAYLPDTMDMG